MGDWYRRQVTARLNDLEKIHEIFNLMISQIRYSRCTLPECCNQVAKYTDEPFRQALLNVYRTMEENTGQEFGEVFRREMKHLIKKTALSNRDGTVLMSLFEGKGYGD